MAYFGCVRKALFYKGFSDVKRRGRIHPTRSILPLFSYVIPAQAGTHPSAIARSEATRQSPNFGAHSSFGKWGLATFLI